MYRGSRNMLQILFRGICGYSHVVEHALHLLGKLDTAFYLELGQHATLCIVRDGPTLEEAFGEVSFVVPFKYVLFQDEAEDRYSLVQNDVDFFFAFLQVI